MLALISNVYVKCGESKVQVAIKYMCVVGYNEKVGMIKESFILCGLFEMMEIPCTFFAFFKKNQKNFPQKKKKSVVLVVCGLLDRLVID